MDVNIRRIAQTQVGIRVDVAVLCPNDDVIYDATRWDSCPTCDNKERVGLSRILNRAREPAGASQLRQLEAVNFMAGDRGEARSRFGVAAGH